MPRLFVAIDLPPDTTAALARLQPPPLAGIKLISRAQMHITLHFIGDAPIAPVIAMLQMVRAPSFSLRLSGLGQFRSRNGGAILWAGVDLNEALIALHAAVVLALSGHRWQPMRRFQPHITLAKCGTDVASQHIARLIDGKATARLPEVPVEGFALYSSHFSTNDCGGVQYRMEQWFPLRSGAADFGSAMPKPLNR